MADWVSKHDAIVVCVDGYVASDYTGFYGGSPWDLMESGGDHDFGPYFLELLNHLDADAPRLLPLPKSDRLRLPPGREVHLPVCIHNPRAEALTDVTVALSSDYPTVTFLSNSAAIPRIEPGEWPI